MDIEIAIDSYDDIFSDFDIRNYHQRQISRDFLDELRVRMVKKSGESGIRIVFLMKAESRNIKHERLITKRLKAFFDDRYASYLGKRKKNTFQAVLFLGLGLGLLLAANVLFRRVGSLYGDFLLIPSWYLVWSALGKLLENGGEFSKKLKYYRALIGSEVEYRGVRTN